MAVKFIDAVRDNPAPCSHYTLTVEVDDATQRTRRIVLSELDDLRERIGKVIGEGPRNQELALAILWIGYHLDHGATIADMRGETIVEPMP